MKRQAGKKYDHAYGSATDIPELLKQLSNFPEKNDYQSEPFYSLWSSLCHQGDVYSASYAAVPHIVSYLSDNPDKASYDYFLLPVCIEIARAKGNGPKLNIELELEYKMALRKLLELVPSVGTADENYSTILSATVAACYGNTELAEIILEITPDVKKEFWDWFWER